MRKNDRSSGLLVNIFSPEMSNEIGCTWIILGHSERRILFHEDGEEKKRKPIFNSSFNSL